MTPRDDGRDRRTLRSQKWSTARYDVTTQERRIRDERRTLFSSRKWKEAEAHFLISLPLILARIKHGREKWISRLWRRLRIQWNTSNTTRMAQAMMVVMTRPNTSILYSLVSFENSTVYDGLVQDRPGTARMTEHSAATSDTNPIELKYRGMKAAGGAAAWYLYQSLVVQQCPGDSWKPWKMWRLARTRIAGIM
jgi:hypothetical protein